MATSVEVLTRRSGRRQPISTPATTSNSTLCSSFLKQQYRGQVMRSFYSAPIVKRSDAVTLKTVDGITIMVHGYINRSRTLENGFSDEVCDHFLIGFPYYWEEFAALPVSEEPADLSGSKGVSRSDAHKAPAPGDKETNMLSRTIFDAMLGEASSAKKERTLPIQTPASVNHRKTNAEKKRRDGSSVEYVKRSGPLTRSRARLLDN